MSKIRHGEYKKMPGGNPTDQCIVMENGKVVNPNDMVVESAKLVVDTRNATGRKRRPAGRVVKA